MNQLKYLFDSIKSYQNKTFLVARNKLFCLINQNLVNRVIRKIFGWSNLVFAGLTKYFSGCIFTN